MKSQKTYKTPPTTMTPASSADCLDEKTLTNIHQWLSDDYDQETRDFIRASLDREPQLLADAFFTSLTFGTGGLRGIVGVGTNRMNGYTVRAATQGLAHYIHKQSHSERPSVIIAYDSRLSSRYFAEEAAKVLAANQIHVYLFEELRPTPLLSFGCRYLRCTAGIMITASHNPPEYNGYKVYWADGGQIVSPHDSGIISEINSIASPREVKAVPSLASPYIHLIDKQLDESYLAAMHTLQHYPAINRSEGKKLKIAYTSLHGTGITLLPRLLKKWGFSNIHLVDEQCQPDGTFPTTSSPNPEDPLAMELGKKLLLQKQCDLLLATDPDADRVGVGVLHQGEAVLLNGNQIAVLCLEHICQAMLKQNCLPKDAAFIKTIGTTELFQAICDRYRVPCFNVLTGFKYIGAIIHRWEYLNEPYQFIFGGEESYGYLLGSHARDKDALISSALICEVALQAKLQGKTLVDFLHALYAREGIYQEKLMSLNFGNSKAGKEAMEQMMLKLRSSPPRSILSIPVETIEDYLHSSRYSVQSGKTEAITLPVSDVIILRLSDQTKIMIRPSGTEPKMKLYCGTVLKEYTNIHEGIKSCQHHCESILDAVKTLLSYPMPD